MEVIDIMKDDRDVLEVLKEELEFVEKGGYGRSVRTPQIPTSVFVDSPACLNYADPARPHPCSECLLIDFVPEEDRIENVPCHHIQLNETGMTVEMLERIGNQQEMEETVRNWLRSTISRIEQERTVKAND